MSKNIDIKKLFGQNLKRLRESKGLTQEQLAEMLELQTYQTINRIENGKTYVSAYVFEKICTIFSVEPYILFLQKEQTYTPETSDKIDELNVKIDKIYNIVSNS